MALTKAYSTPSGVSLPAAYYLPTVIQHDRLNGTLNIRLAAFRDAAARAQAKAAVAAVAAASAALDKAVTAANAVDAKDEVAKAEAMVTVSQAQVALRRAGDGYNGCQPLEFVSVPAVDVPAAAVPGLLNDSGSPDIAKIYGFLKTLPAWSGATDS